MLDVRRRGVRTDIESVGDLLIGLMPCDEKQNLLLSLCQPGRVRRDRLLYRESSRKFHDARKRRHHAQTFTDSAGFVQKRRDRLAFASRPSGIWQA